MPEYQLRDHQSRVSKKVGEGRSLLAAHSMGSGKTLTGLDSARAALEKSKNGRALFVVPAPLRNNMAKEMDKHKIPKELRDRIDIDSYEGATNHKDKYKSQGYEFMLMDEAHRLRNPGLRSTAVREIANSAKQRLLLTGTPIYNQRSDIAKVINNDPRVGGRLKVVFIPNYGVSIAELIMPAADLSEQISTAGTEASGTGNMKFSLNGALTIGTEDGANIEIRDNVGAENMFIFGNTTPQVEAIRKAGYNPRAIYQQNPMLNETLNKIDGGFFSPSERKRYHDLFNSLVNYGDHYLLLADYADYVATQSRVDQLYLHPSEWYRKAILNVAGMGTFSSDRTIRDYAIDTWNMGSLLKKA